MKRLFTKHLTLLLALSVLSLAAAWAQAPDAFQVARSEFQKARGGATESVPRAIDQFQQLVDRHPDNPLFRAYLGSSLALKARDAWFPFTKLSNAEHGLSQIDKALAQLTPEHDRPMPNQVPAGLETRLVAIATFQNMPSMFNRLQQAKDLMAESLALPALEASSAGFRAAFYLQAAKLAARAEQQEQERIFLRRVVEVAQDSPEAKEARQRLEKLGT